MQNERAGEEDRRGVAGEGVDAPGTHTEGLLSVVPEGLTEAAAPTFLEEDDDDQDDRGENEEDVEKRRQDRHASIYRSL